MTTQPLTANLTKAVLNRFQISRQEPDASFLDQLVAAYVTQVPWESASRIVRRAEKASVADCPRWAEEFWRGNLESGSGGTCFESNYAFFSLLLALGYEGYLTINDMGDSLGCHTAIIVKLAGKKWGLQDFAGLT